MAPNMPMQLRFTPSDDRGFASTPFWRTKYELGQAATFGFGERPKYGKSEKDGSVAPNNYGDISSQVPNTRNVVNRKGITIHPKFPSMEERYRDLSWPKSGPGPGKYDTRIPAGQGSWFNPTPMPAWSMQSRPILDAELRAGMGRPGAGDYETRTEAGTNSKIRKGTLYDIKCRGRYPYGDAAGAISPGPARYNHKAGFDTFGLLEKIQNVPIPPRQHRRTSKPTSMPRIDGEEDEELSAEDYEGRTSGERGRQGAPRKHKQGASSRRKLPRVESSPADLGR